MEIVYVFAVTSCKEKALFLLKFSGLTRIASSTDVGVKYKFTLTLVAVNLVFSGSHLEP